MNGSKTIQANFTGATYTLTVGNDGNGSTTPSGASSRACNATVAISATAVNGCYTFLNWSGTGVGSVANPNSASTTIYMNGSKTIQANFTATTYTLTVGNDGNGSTTPSGA